MQLSRVINDKLQYRLALCSHKAVEAGAVCMVLMVQGHLTEMGLAHVALATKTGLLAVFPALGVTFTRYVRHLTNRWTASIFFGVCTFAADSLVHKSHYPGPYTEAALTGVGACVFSLVLSYTPIGKHLDHLAERVLFSAPPVVTQQPGAAADASAE